MTQTVAIKDFRAGLASYVDAGEPVEVTRFGRVVGVFVPAKQRSVDTSAFSAAAAKVREDLRRLGVDPQDVVREFDEVASTSSVKRPALGRSILARKNRSAAAMVSSSEA